MELVPSTLQVYFHQKPLKVCYRTMVEYGDLWPNKNGALFRRNSRFTKYHSKTTVGTWKKNDCPTGGTPGFSAILAKFWGKVNPSCGACQLLPCLQNVAPFGCWIPSQANHDCLWIVFPSYGGFSIVVCSRNKFVRTVHCPCRKYYGRRSYDRFKFILVTSIVLFEIWLIADTTVGWSTWSDCEYQR